MAAPIVTETHRFYDAGSLRVKAVFAEGDRFLSCEVHNKRGIGTYLHISDHETLGFLVDALDTIYLQHQDAD